MHYQLVITWYFLTCSLYFLVDKLRLLHEKKLNFTENSIIYQFNSQPFFKINFYKYSLLDYKIISLWNCEIWKTCFYFFLLFANSYQGHLSILLINNNVQILGMWIFRRLLYYQILLLRDSYTQLHVTTNPKTNFNLYTCRSNFHICVIKVFTF